MHSSANRHCTPTGPLKLYNGSLDCAIQCPTDPMGGEGSEEVEGKPAEAHKQKAGFILYVGVDV